MKEYDAKCPNCGISVNVSTHNKWRPFCSERCHLIDLGEWFNGSKRIVSEIKLINDTLVINDLIH